MRHPWRMARRLASAGLVLVFVTGCATVPVRESFEDARTVASERTDEAAGGVEWIGVTTTVAEVDGAVAALLAEGVTPDEAVQISLLNNRRLQAAYADLAAAAARRTAAGIPPNPVLDAVFRFEQGGDGDVFELSLMEDLWGLLLLPRNRRIAAAELERSRLEVAGRILDLAGATRRAVYRLQAERQGLELARESFLAAEVSSEMATALREAGNVPWLGVLAERDRYEQARLRVAAREMAVAEARETLDQLLGLWGPETGWELAGDLPPLPEPDPEPGSALGDVERRAVERSIDLASALLSVEAASRRLGVERVTSVVGDIEAGVEAEEELEEGGSVWWIGPGLSLHLPIFQQGQPRRTEVRMELRRMWDLYEALAIDVRTAARRAERRLLYAHQRAAYLEEVVVPVRAALVEETQLHYNAMSKGVFELLAAKRRELEARMDALDARAGYWTARSELEQLLAGRLSSGLVRPMDVAGMMDGSMLDGSEGGH